MKTLKQLQKARNKMVIACEWYEKHPKRLEKETYNLLLNTCAKQHKRAIYYLYGTCLNGSDYSKQQILTILKQTGQINIKLTNKQLQKLNDMFDNDTSTDSYLKEIVKRTWFAISIDKQKLNTALSHYYIGDYGYVIIDNDGYHVHGDATDETYDNELCYRANSNDLSKLSNDFPIYADVHDFNDDNDDDFDREAMIYMDKYNFIRIIKEFLDENQLINCAANIKWIAEYVLNMVDWQDLERFVKEEMAEVDLEAIKEHIPAK